VSGPKDLNDPAGDKRCWPDAAARARRIMDRAAGPSGADLDTDDCAPQLQTPPDRFVGAIAWWDQDHDGPSLGDPTP
jgi:hypothetical protein